MTDSQSGASVLAYALLRECHQRFINECYGTPGRPTRADYDYIDRFIKAEDELNALNNEPAPTQSANHQPLPTWGESVVTKALEHGTPTAASEPTRAEPQQPTPQPAYDPPPPDMSLEEQVRHARGFAAGICRNDHHVSRLLEQMARSIEHLAAAAVSAPTAAPQPDKTPGQVLTEMIDDFLRWPLPDSVCADFCATRQGPGRVGTNLLSFVEAQQMFEAIVVPRMEAAAQAVTEQLRERLAEAERELAKWKEHLIAANDDIERLRKQRTAAQHHIADWKHASGCQTPNDLVAALTAERAAREQAERELNRTPDEYSARQILNRPLGWIYTHCAATGTIEPSTGKSMEVCIVEFIMDLQKQRDALQQRAKETP